MNPDARERAVARQVAGLVLGYPDQGLLRRLPELREAVATLPAPLAGPLAGLLDHLEGTPPTQLEADYVVVFDLQRRCSLHLTYYAYGDTRRRGAALLRCAQAYRRAGLELDPAELPDHLSVVLEFAATADAAAGERLLLEHRAGLELLRLALTEAGSPYAAAVAAVCATLPQLAGGDSATVSRLVADGPPVEEVGLDPFATPHILGARR